MVCPFRTILVFLFVGQVPFVKGSLNGGFGPYTSFGYDVGMRVHQDRQNDASLLSAGNSPSNIELDAALASRDVSIRIPFAYGPSPRGVTEFSSVDLTDMELSENKQRIVNAIHILFQFFVTPPGPVEKRDRSWWIARAQLWIDAKARFHVLECDKYIVSELVADYWKSDVEFSLSVVDTVNEVLTGVFNDFIDWERIPRRALKMRLNPRLIKIFEAITMVALHALMTTQDSAGRFDSLIAQLLSDIGAKDGISVKKLIPLSKDTFPEQQFRILNVGNIF